MHFSLRFRAWRDGKVVAEPAAALFLGPLYFEDGQRSAASTFRYPRCFLEAITPEGVLEFRHSVGVDGRESGPWGVALYHPRFGSAYLEASLEELRAQETAGGVFDVELDRGLSIAGRAVDQEGTPVPGAHLSISGATADTSAGVLIAGLYGVSDDEGEFEIVGIQERFRSTPTSIDAHLRPEDGGSGPHLYGRKAVKDKDFEAARGVWVVGDVVMKPYVNVRARAGRQGAGPGGEGGSKIESAVEDHRVSGD